ncbi:SPW repeat protein [Pullulanibacillus sp. KACC 23026]|uniref:SPW repeat protein n=1 Tax=Pullulanibacillus sp. KACC 23026 TaxID=3028315 RepID=UPI0023B0E5E1|nr:SPW repeat protein [Pullulanibacillus sp. KACC 23026]WEG12872.1 SPW repeat protein [Pullulanibacillus sp. KACC 23026]
MKWAQWLNALIGIWFIISPWTLGFSQISMATTLSVIFGAILLIVSFWAAVQEKAVNWSSWLGWVSLIMGVLVIVVSFSFSLSAAAMWTNAILGVIVVILDLFAMGKSE